YYDRGYNGIHYKKERAYDKRLEYEQISDTINMLAISQEQEIYLDRHATEGRINIVTQKEYIDIPYGIAIPLKKDDVAFASIAFWGMEPFIDMELVYETLKLISQMLRRSLANELKQNAIKASNKKMFFIYEHMSSGVKELMEGHIHLSSQAKNILGSLEDISEADFLAHIHPSDLVAYTSLVEELYKSLSPNQSIEYQYKKNGEYVEIKETFFPCYENGIISLYSLIEDHTRVKVQKDELYDIAYTHPISKLSTEAKLGMDIQNLLEHRKLSLAIFDIHDIKFYEEIYGLNLVNQLIYAVAAEMKNYFSSNFQIQLYHLGFDRYAILAIDINDKRTMDHLLFDAFTKVSNHLSVLNSRIKLYFNCGVYRLSKNANIQDPNKLLDFAYDALSDAKSVQEVGHHISHYDSEASKLRFAEHQLITQISESIDHGKLGVLYKQLIYLTEKQVYAYVAYVTMDNYEIDPSYMKKVIERKCLEEQIDKYVIRCCSKELKMLGDVSKSSIPILIPLNRNTLESNFVAFVENQNQFYKTTKRLIFYYADGAHIALKKLKALGYKVATSNVVDVLQDNSHYYIHDVSKYGFDGILDLLKLCKEKGVKLILSQVTTKEEVLKATELGIEYIYGNYWKKSIRMNKVIEKFA
ncbi:MAG: diguanylate cyclase, partial [Anaeroplasmataceae bacterium]|nr:diguanylate cyclase [Anaeroplasmataceae bacterium]